MVSVTSQMLQQQRKERAIASAQQRQQIPDIAPISESASYEQQIEYQRQQIARNKELIAQYEKSLQPTRRTAGFTPRKERLQMMQQTELAKAEVPKAYSQLQETEQQVSQFEGQVKQLRVAEEQLRIAAEYEATWKQMEKAASKGMLWAHKLYGTDIQKQVIRDMEKSGYDTSYMGLASKKAYEARKNLLRDIRSGLVDNVKIVGNTIKNMETNKPIGLSSVSDKYREQLSQGFDYYKTPQKGWVDPNTGRLIEMSIREDYAKNKGYLPVEVQAFNKKTGEYISSSQTGLLTQQQKRMYDLFQDKPQAAAFLGFNINQSAKLPTEFVLKGSTQPMEYQKPDYFNQVKPSGSAYEAASRMSPFTAEERNLIEFKQNPLKFIQEKGYGYTKEGKKDYTQKMYSGEASPLLITKGPGSWGSAFNLAGIAVLPKAVATFGAKKAIGYAFSDPITKTISGVTSRIIPEQKSGFALSGAPAQIGRGLIFYGLAANPFGASAFVTSMVKKAVTDPIQTAKDIGKYASQNPYEVATGFVAGGVHRRINEVIARNRIYNEVNSKLIKEYGIKSIEVKDFQTAWNRAFKELPKQAPLTKPFSVKQLEAISGDAKAVKLVEGILKKYSPEVIGTSVILPQTRLKTPPRGKFGDIDIQNVRGMLFTNNSKKLAMEIYSTMKKAGYDIKFKEAVFMGNKKYYLSLNGKEFINIGTSSKYFLKTQAGPLRDLFEAERFRQFTRDPLTNTLMGNIRAQLRVKIVKGYVGADIKMIRTLSELYKQGKIAQVKKILSKLEGREKDIIDSLGIVKGTDYLIKSGKYIGPKQTTTPAQFVLGVRDAVSSKLSEGFRLSSKGPVISGYYKPTPGQSIAYRNPEAYDKKYSAPRYSPTNYVLPKLTPKYTAKPNYKNAYKKIDSYFRPVKYNESYKAQPKYQKPVVKQPRYDRQKYDNPLYSPPRYNKQPRYSPPYSPPRPTPQPVRNLLIAPSSERKVEQVRQPIRRPSNYLLTPTITQKIYKVRRRTKAKRITGFEALRI
jgi:hypothetical protein